MPKYALLGATGSTGSSVLRYLLEEPPKGLKVNILVRNKTKLLNAFPKLEETSAFEVTITVGTPNDSNALQQCLEGSNVIINCIATNESRPDTSIAYDTAAAVIDSLKTLRKLDGATYQTPTVVTLRAAPVNPVFAAQMPAFGRAMIWFILRFCYLDLQKAGQLYAQIAKEEPGLLEYIYVDSGATQDADGTERTGYELVTDGHLEGFVSFADLGAAICELAERHEDFEGKGVGVAATGKVNMTLMVNFGYAMDAIKNRILHFFGLI